MGQHWMFKEKCKFVLPYAPVVLVACFIIAANAVFIAYRVALPYPISPWEAGIVVDAWRMAEGLPVYSDVGTHVTHMYGPLITASLAGAFEILGHPNLEFGREMSAVAGALVIVLLILIFARRDLVTITISVALLLAANTRSGYYFTETRPDLISVFFAASSLMTLCYAQERTKGRYYITILGTILLVVATFFKQTAAPLSLVPMLAMILKYKDATRRTVVASLIPFGAVVLTLAAVYLFDPNVWHFMIQIPAQYRVSVLRMARAAVELVASVPLFALALAHWLFTDASETRKSAEVRWLIAAMVCAVPMSLAAVAKDGGAANSLIPAILVLSAFCVWRLAIALDQLRNANRPFYVRAAMGILLGVLLFSQVYPVPGQLSMDALNGGHGTSERGIVISEIRQLPGRVVSPDDPTIALFATGYAGRTAVFEADAVYWDASKAEGLMREIKSADYLVAMRPGLLPGGKSQVTTGPGWGTTDEILLAHGFVRRNFDHTSSSVYELWQKVHAAPTDVIR